VFNHELETVVNDDNLPPLSVLRTISLTFDNGPEPGVTDFVLDTLASGGSARPSSSSAASSRLHDLPTGAMAQLPSFLDRALDEGAHFSDDFPSSCVVLERGVPQGPLEAYVRAAS
jgi:hypothetical protein